MALFDKPLDDLRVYRSSNPKPVDFDEYWAVALQELEATDPQVELIPNHEMSATNVECFDLWFRGVGGARIYSKYVRPKVTASPASAVLMFHGYSYNSGDWLDKIAYAGQGIAVAAMDCRGQGGRSEDVGGVKGTTLRGHFVRGLDDAPERMLFRSIFLDTVQLARVVMSFPEIDATRLATFGGSQGGALAVACAALEPRVRRCVSAFPFLSDFRRVWEMDFAKDAYPELRDYLRRFDPRHERITEIFTRLGYIDISNLAPRITADVLMGITLMDTTCPPSTQFAVYNAIASPKEALIYPDYAHEALPGFVDAAFNFITGM